MILHFPTRDKARDYARTSGNPMIDNGNASLPGKRWACEARIIVLDATAAKPTASKPVLNSLKRKIVVVINADKTATDGNIEDCFSQALAKWKTGKPKPSDTTNRHTAKAELAALFN